jgi:hypothetical protein
MSKLPPLSAAGSETTFFAEKAHFGGSTFLPSRICSSSSVNPNRAAAAPRLARSSPETD